MSDSMLATNLQIIADLKNFLVQTMENKFLLDKYRLTPRAFSRRRSLPFEVLVMLILNTLKRSLTVELNDFFAHFPQYVSCTKQALSAQRRKLSPLFYHHWNALLVAKFYHYNSLRVKRWKGLRIYGVDGSSVNLPDSRELGVHYGFARHRSGGSPTARVSVLYDVLNELVIKSGLYPFYCSERDMACEYLDYMQEDTLVLFDRGYPSFWFIYLIMLRKPSCFFLMRCRVDFSKEMREFVKSASKDKVLDFRPSYKSMEKLKSMGILISRHTTIKLRVLSVLLPTGEREILITNLMGKRLYTARELKELYYLRWRVETFYCHMKNQLQLEQFSGISSICIEQDFAANMFLFNLQSLIQKQCEPYLKAVSKKRRYAYKINRNISFANLKYRLVELFLKEKVELWLKELQLLFEKSLQAIKTNREYPHRRKRMFENTKYRTLTNYKRAI